MSNGTIRSDNTTMKPSSARRRRSLPSAALGGYSVLLLVLTVSETMLHGSDAFGLQRWRQRRAAARLNSPPSVIVSGSPDIQNGNNGSADSWSNPVPGSSSPLKVRKRVKAVLEKARIRTGVGNASAMSTGAASVVAEAASIGGLGVDGPADIVLQLKPRNGTAVPSSTATTEQQEGGGGSGGTSTRVPRSVTDEELALSSEYSIGYGLNSNGSKQPESSSSISSSSSSAATNTPPPKTIPSRKPSDFDVIRGDVPAATKFIEPLPFKLPKLSAEQKKFLEQGERVQEQSRMGREGSGFVVIDVKAPPFVVWECLLDFESYPETIPTVRGMQLYTSEKLNIGFVNEKPVLPGTGRETRHYGTPSITRASFVLSKFRLNIAAIHRYTPHPEGDYMEFTLDRSCTNMVLKGAKGIWYTEKDPDGREVRGHQFRPFSI